MNNSSCSLSSKVNQHLPIDDAQWCLRYHKQCIRLLIINYILAGCKWSVLVTTALHARNGIAHCSEEKHKQDLSTPQKLLRTLANIYVNMKGQRSLILEIKNRKRPCKAYNLTFRC